MTSSTWYTCARRLERQAADAAGAAENARRWAWNFWEQRSQADDRLAESLRNQAARCRTEARRVR